MTKPSARQQAAYREKRNALLAYLQGASSADIQSLSRSYGLPVRDVERIVQESRNAY